MPFVAAESKMALEYIADGNHHGDGEDLTEHDGPSQAFNQEFEEEIVEHHIGRKGEGIAE